jgi:hypothetical protein
MRRFKIVVSALCIVALALVACDGHHRSGSKTTVASQADAKDLPRVIIKQFNAKGIEANEASTLADSFCTELSKHQKAELFCPGDLAKLLEQKEMQMMFGQCDEEDCLSKMGEKTEADIIVLGTISKMGETFVVQVKLANGKTGKVQTRISHEVDSDKIEDLLPAMSIVADKVVAEL